MRNLWNDFHKKMKITMRLNCWIGTMPSYSIERFYNISTFLSLVASKVNLVLPTFASSFKLNYNGTLNS